MLHPNPEQAKNDATRVEIEITLLGSFSLRVAQVPVVRLPKACQELIAMLAISHGRFLQRDVAAQRIWPEAPHEIARFYLRRALTQIRSVLGSSRSVLESRGIEELRLNPNHVTTDVLVCEMQCASGEAEALVAAALLLGTHLLPRSNSLWVEAERQRIEQLKLTAAMKAVNLLLARGDFVGSIKIATLALSVDPTNESIIGPFWQALIHTGQDRQFLTSYRKVMDHFRRAEIQPSPSLLDIAKRLHREVDSLVDSSKSAPVIRGIPKALERDHPFIGRESSIRDLVLLLRHHRLVELIAPPGWGKSRLAFEVAKRLGWSTEFVDSVDSAVPAHHTSLRTLRIYEARSDQGEALKESIADSLANPAIHVLVVSLRQLEQIETVQYCLPRLQNESACQLLATLLKECLLPEESVIQAVAAVDGNPKGLTLIARLLVSRGIDQLDGAHLEGPIHSAVQSHIVLPWLESLSGREVKAIGRLNWLPVPLRRHLVGALLEDLPEQVTSDEWIDSLCESQVLAISDKDHVLLSPLLRLAEVGIDQKELASTRILDFYSSWKELPDEDVNCLLAACEVALPIHPDLVLVSLSQFRRQLSDAQTSKLLSGLIGHPPSAAERVIDAWLRLGGHEHDLHNLTLSVAAFRQANADSDKLDDPTRKTDSLLGLGEVLANAGELDSAEIHLREALQISQNCQNRSLEARALRTLGYVNRLRRNLDVAIELTSKALALHTLLREGDGRVWCLGSLAGCLFEQGEFELALGRFEEALAIHRRTGNLPGISWNLTSMAEVANKLGRYDQAKKFGEEALAIQEALQTQHNAWPFHVLAESLAQLGDLAEAERLLIQSLEVLRSSGNESAEAHTLIRLAVVCYRGRDIPSGNAYLALAEEIGRKLEHPGILHAVANTGINKEPRP